MKTLYVKDVIKHLNGRLLKGNLDHWFYNVNTHTGKLKPYSLLFDLRRRGHLDRAAWKNNPYTVVVTDNAGRYSDRNCPWTVIQVNNVKESYWNFISYYRRIWNIPFIGVTGTCGKTTVKEMIAHILSSFGKVQATYKSMNGLSHNLKYLMEVDENTSAAVMEVGVGAPNDLITSCHYFKPDIGIITMIGTDHLEHCGSQENYIRAKARLLRGMNNKGTLILNGDCRNTRKIDTSSFRGKIITFGFRKGSDFQVNDYSYSNGGMEFTFTTDERTFSAFVPGYGKHNIYNALATFAAAKTLDIDLTYAISLLAKFKHVERHLQLKSGIKGSTVIDDTWSSNPNSTEAALQVLKEVGKGKHKVAILGKMSLLGKYSRKEHEAIGDLIMRYGIDVLITVDKTSEWIAKRALKLGMNKDRVFSFRSSENVYSLLKRYLDPNTIVLLKTSMLDRSRTLNNLIVQEADVG